jgi:DNA-binding FrmR family transcriptional regulator
MYKPKDTQEKILHRLKIARGHLDKVIEMVENNQYCINVLHQSSAVQAALKETNSVILENHLKTCVSDSIKNGNQEEAIKEVMEVFKKTN